MIEFDGSTYEAKHDRERLTGQILRVFDVVRDGKWHTLYEISAITSDPFQSISARLRDLRKPRFGAFTIERRRRGDPAAGLFEYRFAGRSVT